MRFKCFLNPIFLFLCSFSAFSADFSPTPMSISVQPQLEYKFDGSPLEIPFTLTGKSGAVWLVINTHGQAENIRNVRNGYLGWHYVNKIDTTIYISDRFERQPGETSIIWDGRDENGNKAEPGTYDYYLWGYDNKSSNMIVNNYIRSGCNTLNQQTQLYEKDEGGMPLSNPMLMGNFNRIDIINYSDDIYRNGTNFKWLVGNDPMDKSLIQTTICAMYYPELPIIVGQDDEGHDLTNPDWITYGGSGYDPKDYSIFFQPAYKKVPIQVKDGITYVLYYTLFSWEFVPNGEAVLNSEWFGWENKMWELGEFWSYNNCITSNDYIYIPDSDPGRRTEYNTIKCIDYDGNLIFDKQFHEWYNPQAQPLSTTLNNSIDKIFIRDQNRMFLLSSYSCMHQLINPSRLFDDPDDETDMVLFTNSNGDYFMDNGWQSNIQYPWFCISGRLSFFDGVKENTLKKTAIAIDSNDFNLIFVRNYSIASFGVSTQDGTGIDYMSFADDSSDRNCAGGVICDSGSAYDGIYFSDIALSTDTTGFWPSDPKTYYMAFDSAHGMITNNPAVQEQTPLQFKVSQNTPNPFNPSTTISFTVPEKSDVIIDIYNIMGQKIKTLINGPMSAGEHSVKWDANGCSAGVYFYKVKAGKYEKTMKMTLLR